MKIHIIGCSGSGKTYLAKALSQAYNIPHLDLDEIFWDNQAGAYGTKSPPEIRDAKLDAMLKNADWVIEGVYYAWVQRSFLNADVIYVLDIPKSVYISRIIRRRKLSIEPDKSGSLKSLVSLIRWTDKFQKKHRKKIQLLLDAYPEKVRYLSSTREINALIKSLPIAVNETAG